MLILQLLPGAPAGNRSMHAAISDLFPPSFTAPTPSHKELGQELAGRLTTDSADQRGWRMPNILELSEYGRGSLAHQKRSLFCQFSVRP